jgi:hypothetical protein
MKGTLGFPTKELISSRSASKGKQLNPVVLKYNDLGSPEDRNRTSCEGAMVEGKEEFPKNQSDYRNYSTDL